MLVKKDFEQTKAEELADYLAGRGSLAEQFYSIANLTAALGILLDDPDTSQEEIVSGLRSIMRSHKHHFDEVNVVRRALKVRREGEPMFGALMMVRQARIRASMKRRR